MIKVKFLDSLFYSPNGIDVDKYEAGKDYLINEALFDFASKYGQIAVIEKEEKVIPKKVEKEKTVSTPKKEKVEDKKAKKAN